MCGFWIPLAVGGEKASKFAEEIPGGLVRVNKKAICAVCPLQGREGLWYNV